ncbi:hypothetical protein H6761_02520 [Candidatus Nomurabacteria bacterium]|nr:hypothetical protein [Candidatus Nomurabacteria bacterium]
MKKVLANWHLSLLVLAASVLSLILIQNYVLAAWQAPSTDPGDNSGVNTPLIPDQTGNVDLEDNNIINVDDLRVNTLTATTSLEVLGIFNASGVEINTLTMPHTPGVGYGTIDITADDSTLSITGPLGSSSAGTFTAGVVGSGQASYGLYASTVAGSGVASSYAVAGVSNNAGGTAIYGLGNSGWAGYFSGPVGIAGALAIGNNNNANGAYSFAGGQNATADGDYAFSFGYAAKGTGAYSVALGGDDVVVEGDYSSGFGNKLTVAGSHSVGIGLSDSVNSSIWGNNVLAIMGGDVGIGVDPSYKLHLLGDYYQDGMMQIQPTTALLSSENIIYANAPSGSSNSAHLLRLQNNGTDKFRVTALGAGVFASTISATQGTFTSGVVAGASTFNSGLTAGGSIALKSGAPVTFSSSNGSYFDFNDDDDSKAPACKSGSDGIVYNFETNKVLCYCDGSSWISMVNGKADSLCASK